MNWRRSVRVIKLFVGVLLCGLAGGMTKAQAATTYLNSITFDLTTTTISSDGSGGEILFYGSSSPVSIPLFTPAVGDTLVTTISFVSGQSLVLTNTGGGVFPNQEVLTVGFYPGTVSMHGTTTTSILFTGVTGSLLSPSFSPGCTGILCQQVFGNFTNSSFGFTGFQITSTVTALSPSGAQFDHVGIFAARAGDIAILSATQNEAPEPATLALLGLGFIGLGLSRWRRRSVAHGSGMQSSDWQRCDPLLPRTAR